MPRLQSVLPLEQLARMVSIHLSFASPQQVPALDTIGVDALSDSCGRADVAWDEESWWSLAGQLPCSSTDVATLLSRIKV